MVVEPAMVVVEVQGGDARLEELDGFVDAAVLFRIAEMGVGEIKSDAYVAEVADVEDWRPSPRPCGPCRASRECVRSR